MKKDHTAEHSLNFYNKLLKYLIKIFLNSGFTDNSRIIFNLITLCFNTWMSTELFIIDISAVILGLFGIVGNSLVLTLFFKHKELRKIDTIYMMIMLATADIVCTLGALVYGVMHLRMDSNDNLRPNKGMCLGASFLAAFGVTLSQLMTVMIGLDRYSAIVAPIAYRRRNHKIFAMGSFAMIVLYGAVTCSLLFVGVDFSEIPDQCGIGSSTTKSWTIYWGLFGMLVCAFVCITYLLTLSKFRQIVQTHRNAQMTTSMSRREEAVQSTVSSIVLIYIILFGVPNFAYVIALGLWEDAILFSPYIMLGSALNSSVNVLVYAVKHNDFRASMLVSFGISVPSTLPSSTRSPRLPPLISDSLITAMK